MRAVARRALASSLLPAALGIVRVAAQSIASFALTSPSAQQPRAAPSSTRKDTSSAWRFSDRGAARWRFPGLTINRAVDQLLPRGHVFRGYLGVSLQPVKREAASNGSQSSGGERGVLVVGLDPDGPSARAGMLVGDIVTAWDGKPINRVREVVRLLGSESVGRTVDLSLIRGGTPVALKVVIGERPVK